jgi:probable HAF family extracellular repeat protein
LALRIVALLLAGYGERLFGQGASFQGLGDLPGGAISSGASAVSADGTTVVGVSLVTDHSPAGTEQEAFRWTAAEGMVGLGDLDTAFMFSRARDVSGDGSVIVGEGSLGPDDNNMRPYRWTLATGMVQLVDVTGALDLIRAEGVSADGLVIVGHANPPTFENLAYRWTQAQGVQSLGALPNPDGFLDSFAFDVSADGSVITGCSLSGGLGNEAFVWTQATGMVGVGDVPGGEPYAIAWGISPDGTTIVGNARHVFDFLSRDEAFIWSKSGGFVFPDPLHAASAQSTAFAASENGSIVVGYDGNVGGAFVWDAQHGARSIHTVLTANFGLDLTGWTLQVAYDVAADGETIVGSGTNPQGQPEAWIARIPRQTGTPVPASSDWAMPALLLSLAAAAGLIFGRMARVPLLL